jgi:hypothetical protein
MAGKRGGRTAGDESNGKVNPTLAPDAIKCLELLAKMGRYGGNTKTSVAGYLIMRELDDLTRSGVLPKTFDE